MRRSPIVKAIIPILCAGFVAAVQHDTFVRRWCLPSPPPQPHPNGVLQSPVTDFDLRGLTGRKAIERIEEKYKVRIGLARATDWPELDHKLAGRVRTATVEQLLWRICGASAEVEGDTECVESPDGIFLRYGVRKAERVVLRAYNVSDAGERLSAPNIMVPKWVAEFPLGNRNPSSAPDDATRITRLTVHGKGGFIEENAKGQVRADPVVRFGNRILVVGTERTHWLISEMLRE